MTTSNPKTIKARNAKRYANDPQYRQAIDAAIEQREQIEKAAKRAKAEQAKQGREWLKAQAAQKATPNPIYRVRLFYKPVLIDGVWRSDSLTMEKKFSTNNHAWVAGAAELSGGAWITGQVANPNIIGFEIYEEYAKEDAIKRDRADRAKRNAQARSIKLPSRKTSSKKLEG